MGGEDIVLTKSSKNQAAATEFMRYMVSEEAQLAMAKVGQMPVLANLGDKLTSVNGYYAPFITQLATARPRPVTPAWSEMDAMLQDEVRSAIKGDKSVKSALDEAASKADALLANVQK